MEGINGKKVNKNIRRAEESRSQKNLLTAKGQPRKKEGNYTWILHLSLSLSLSLFLCGSLGFLSRMMHHKYIRNNKSRTDSRSREQEESKENQEES
jgi:hypothetical protein